MKEPHIEELATHDVPESCVVVREDGGEALTGAVRAGLLSREIRDIQSADAVEARGRQHR